MNDFLFVGTTVGNTHYLDEWLAGVKILEPKMVVISIDDSRHGEIPQNHQFQLIHYDTKNAWEGYEARHKGWISDYSIGLGIKNLIKCFLESDCNKFLCIDSDVILDIGISNRIKTLNYDYLRIGVPASIRERIGLTYLHWKSSNFGISRRIAERLYPELDLNLQNSYPIDLNFYAKIKALEPEVSRRVKSGKVIHYLNSRGKTRRVSTREAQLRNLYARPFMIFYGKINPLKYSSFENNTKQ
jgi:hypothetical protein